MNINAVTENTNFRSIIFWQKVCLFLAVLLVPLQAPPLYVKYFGSFSLYGQPASFPILVGLLLACIACVKENNVRIVLLPCCIVACVYMGLIAVISLHAIVGFDSYTIKTMGVTPKIALVRDFLTQMGLVNDNLAYQVIVFFKDLRNGFVEAIFIFGFVAWVGVLGFKDCKNTFKIVQNAVLLDFVLLFPYVILEIFHLYGVGVATELLKTINPFFYTPCAEGGWYPPLVSSNQVRGIWTEPGFFSIWLAFSFPFLIHWITKSGGIQLKQLMGRWIVFVVFFLIWFLTYARTSIYMAFAFAFVSFAITLYLRTKESMIHGALLLGALVVAFALVSNFGPQDISRWTKNQPVINKTQIFMSKKAQPADNKSAEKHHAVVQKEESKFIEGTVKSAFSVDSRSTPARVQYWICRFRVFSDSPLLGRGDSFEPWYESRKYLEFGSSLSPELRQRLRWIDIKGLFNAGFGGNRLSLTGMLACRGIVGTLMYAVPIFVFFIFLMKSIYLETNRKEKFRALCLFLSCSVVVMSAFVQGLWFFDFWISCGVAVGWILCRRAKTSISTK